MPAKEKIFKFWPNLSKYFCFLSWSLESLYRDRIIGSFRKCIQRYKNNRGLHGKNILKKNEMPKQEKNFKFWPNLSKYSCFLNSSWKFFYRDRINGSFRKFIQRYKHQGGLHGKIILKKTRCRHKKIFSNFGRIYQNIFVSLVEPGIFLSGSHYWVLQKIHLAI